MKVVIPSLTSSKHPRFVSDKKEISLRKQPPLLAAETSLAARSGDRRLLSNRGSNTEQDTEEVKRVRAPFHHSTEDYEGKEYSDPPSQPIFATCFSLSFCDMLYAE